MSAPMTPRGEAAADRMAELIAELMVEPLAQRVAELLAPRLPPTRLVCAKEVADALGVGMTFVYENAASLGGRRLGNGRRQLWRFDLAEVRAALRKREERPMSTTVDIPTKPRRRKPTGTSAALLPFRGQED
jgi:hypothetical protein